MLLTERCKAIKVLGVDVDGTLTDGLYHYTDNGVISKTFHTKDYWALEQLQKAGVQVVILTGATDNVIDYKVKGLPDYCKTNMVIAKGVEDKVEWMAYHLGKNKWNWDNLAFIGDGGNDLEVMQHSAITACPSDALPMIKKEANIVCQAAGGKGAVCEFVLHLLEGMQK